MRFCKRHIAALLALAILLLSTGGTRAQSMLPTVDPAQSITYWKPHVLTPGSDPAVARAHAVFQILLRAWDRTRLAPTLYVIDAATRLWAASLADGSILLTRSALGAIFEFGDQRAEHLLAFVLAHELAHQSADDLWHQRFFRLIGDQDPAIQQQLALGLNLNAEMLADMAEKEAQADHDGLLMMSSVGYDPHQILDEKDFFTAWIENLWQAPCSNDAVNTAVTQTIPPMSAEAEALSAACGQARARALRTAAQLKAVATQTTLYTMGVQALVAGRMQAARHYFSAFGHSYTNRAVLYALGVTHLYEALESLERLRGHGDRTLPDFYYPLLLDAAPTAVMTESKDPLPKRSTDVAVVERERQRMGLSLERAIQLFEKAIRLAPDHPKTYLMLACSYLMSGNTFMANGIVQGKYVPKFGRDAAADLILAMTLSRAGEHVAAQRAFTAVIDDLRTPPNLRNTAVAGRIPDDLLMYSAVHNSAALAIHGGEPRRARDLWQALARHAQIRGNGVLFHLALNQLRIGTAASEPLATAPKVAGLRIGDRFGLPPGSSQPFTTEQFWIAGEPHRLWRMDGGSRIVVGPEATIIGAWQAAGTDALAERIAIGDDATRPLKAFGIPDRRYHLVAGEYWAYDTYGVAVHLEHQQIAGWFLYDPQ